ncbi:MAG: hypothetical protein Q9214_001671 [Letrouitia sp. 1 TL-2023]
MPWVNRKGRLRYQAVVQERNERTPDRRISRVDDLGAWNILKGWYLFLVHLISSILLFVIMIQWVDGHKFKAGSPSLLLASDLYQTHVTGLISLALVIIKLLTSSGSALLVWRTIFILLDQGGITLKELVRLGNHGFIIPRVSSRNQLLWACWVVAVTVLLWLPSFAAPLANSSVAWIPSSSILAVPASLSMRAVGQFSDWSALNYEDMRMIFLVKAAWMAGKDPAYAFDSTELPLRRYFYTVPLDEDIPADSIMNLTLPYFDVDLRWIDAASDNRSHHISESTYAVISTLDFQVRDNGVVSVIRDDPWNPERAVPQAAQIFSGRKLVSIKVSTLNAHDRLLNGSAPTQDSPCPAYSPLFGSLPDVGQFSEPYFKKTIWAANDCYLVAEASIMAGIYHGTNCTVSPIGAKSYMATCNITPDPDAVEGDWISRLALDFMSGTMKYIAMVNLTRPSTHDDLDEYITGMLRLGYHAAWSSLVKHLGNASEPETIRAAETAVVYATIDWMRLGLWLAMSAMLTLSAVLVAVAQNLSATKTIRDTTFAALAMDLTEVTHSSRSRGLCNAVALNKEDRSLPRLKWEGGCDINVCHRRVVFAERDTAAHEPLRH